MKNRNNLYLKSLEALIYASISAQTMQKLGMALNENSRGHILTTFDVLARYALHGDQVEHLRVKIA